MKVKNIITEFMENKQTAVDWLEHELIKRGVIRRGFMIPDNIFNQAKAMEKEQINRAYYDGYYQETMYDARRYYDDTYGNSKQA